CRTAPGGLHGPSGDFGQGSAADDGTRELATGAVGCAICDCSMGARSVAWGEVWMSRALPGMFSGLFAVIGGVGIGACTPEPDPEPRPFEDAWRLELDLPFPYLDAAGTTARIKSLTIGGREEDDNFANRGHVIVQFDPAGTAADGRIRVEMRRYTMARTA